MKVPVQMQYQANLYKNFLCFVFQNTKKLEFEHEFAESV